MNKIVSINNLKISPEKADYYVLNAIDNLIDNLNPKIETIVYNNYVKIYILDECYSKNGLVKRIKEISIFEYISLLKYGMKLSGINKVDVSFYVKNNKVNYVVSNDLGKVRRKNFSYGFSKNW